MVDKHTAKSPKATDNNQDPEAKGKGKEHSRQGDTAAKDNSPSPASSSAAQAAPANATADKAKAAATQTSAHKSTDKGAPAKTPAETTAADNGTAGDDAIGKHSHKVVDHAPVVHRRMPWLSVINFILILCILYSGVWAWMQWPGFQQQLNRTQTSQISQLIDNEIARLTPVLEQSERRQRDAMEELRRLLEEQQALIESNRRLLAQNTERKVSDWVLAEADYLVRMAGRKIWLEQDSHTAILMLQEADERLASLADPSLLPIRRLLAGDIQRLREVRSESLMRQALALAGLVQQAESLPLAMVEMPGVEQAPADTSLSTSADDWRSNLARSWRNFVSDFITIRPRSEAVKPLMSEQQQWLVKQQMKFHLLQAQQALLQRQGPLFIQGVGTAKHLLNQHFDGQDAGVQAFTERLDELLALRIERQLPKQLDAAEPLRDTLEQRVNAVFVQHTVTGGMQ